MIEQNGNSLDILCDAAGSDLLLGDFFRPPSPATRQPVKRVKLSDDSSSSSPAGPSHVCHICKKVYERADHLTRHLRSHENARPYQCTRCPKRFNRADLLTRHETTHDRDDSAGGRTVIRRSDRAAEACLNCAASKAKCDDQKPCGRCQNKNLVCQTASKQNGQPTISPSDSLSSANPPVESSEAGDLYVDRRMSSFAPSVPPIMDNGFMAAPYMQDNLAQTTSAIDVMSEDIFYFNPSHDFLQDLDFSSWDLDFDSYTIPQIDISGPSPESSITCPVKIAHSRDPSRAHAAFKRSPWLWEPGSKDNLIREQEGVMLNEELISHSPAYEKMLASTSTWLRMKSADRDRLFAIVLSQHKDSTKVPSFPSLDLLNYLLQTHFVHDEYQTDSWIHSASFDPSRSNPECLAALISSGAVFISVPEIWQFGLALSEVARMALASLFESNNTNTRDIQALQAFMANLDVGLWSGFKRKMEIAESFLQPLLTMVRRAGALSAPPDTSALIPSQSDSREILNAKWRKFIRRESYKRLVMHMFFHDTQASIGLQKNPLMSYTELSFSVPVSRDLWRAPTAEAWRDLYLHKKPLPVDSTTPRVCDIMHGLSMLDMLGGFVDIELCYSAILHGYWGQISAYREAVKFYSQGISSNPQRNATHRLWITSQHQELYRDICEFSLHIDNSSKGAQQLPVIAELLMMILHVSPEDIQRFAGKFGEDEARRTATSLEDGWIKSREARHAVWHAGQVFRAARQLPPASLRGFNAIAVYLAAMTLWAYGLLSCSSSTQGQDGNEMAAPPPKYVLVDGDESRDTKAFLQLDKGVPGITLNCHAYSGTQSLSNPGMVLEVARNMFRDNYPVQSEPLPPLVESLRNLLRDLGTGQAGRASPNPIPAESAD